MFQYQSLFRKNASNQAGKIIGLTILAGIFITISFFAVFIITMLPSFAFGDSAWVLLYLFFIFFLLFLFSVFVIYPLSIGIIKFFTSAYTGESYGFSDLFFVFRERRYGKAVKLTILVLIGYIIISIGISMLMQLAFTLVNLPFSALLGGLSYENSIETSAAMITGQIGVFILMAVVNLTIFLLMYIPYVLLMIYMFLVYLVFVDQPHIPTMDKFSIAFKVMFQAGQSLVKLFFSNVLLLAGVTILYFVLIIGGALLIGFLLSAFDSVVLVVLAVVIPTLIFLVLYIYVMYLMVGSIVSFYYKGRKVLDVRASEAAGPRDDEREVHDNDFRDDDFRALDDRDY
ncbi:hypothetical protein [Lacicoccus qingdaonensis]|uniref:Membrane domain of glycerophosphoryl diester phosphodiesterase n=1 Tax=Lacicoccus qingdaonensis TaxID=576118 RepID=A0A1G9GYK1_9BACL|nr:hypothetical protein [Salinicoccus qingdaonensis]SDL05747.1 hypothetical protein SAMN05216216_11959 [Salinicoccus qingdaonensis]